MAVLPAELVESHPHCVGLAMPGGSFELVPHPDAPEAGTGEIVYRGPNVMMGYADAASDLSVGHTIDVLHTGDLGRFDDGLLRIVGRASRFVKLFGERIDLEAVEQVLQGRGIVASCCGDDEILAVAVTRSPEGGSTPDRIVDLVTSHVRIPRRAVVVVRCDELPRLSSGKPDTVTVVRQAHELAHDAVDALGGDTSVAQIFTHVLGRAVGPTDTFVSLGGDSLSYVEASIRLEQLLGALPPDWHLAPVSTLQATVVAEPIRSRRTPRMETGVVLRAAAIVTVVGTHMGVIWVRGGAHVLLAVAGFNFARFQLTAAEVPDRVRRSARSIARIAVPASLWIGAQMVLVGGYSVGAALLVNNYVGSSWRTDARWNYWYLDVVVQLSVVLAIVFSIGPLRRCERRRPFTFAMAVVAITSLLRFEVVQFGDPYNAMFRTHTVAWCFAIGWAAARARTGVQRCVVSAAALLAAPGFFGDPSRERIVMAGMVALVWIATVPVPRVLHRTIGALAGASMYIYLVHWHTWPLLLQVMSPWLAFAGTLVVGLAVAAAISWLSSTLIAVSARASAGRSLGRIPSVHRTRIEATLRRS